MSIPTVEQIADAIEAELKARTFLPDISGQGGIYLSPRELAEAIHKLYSACDPVPWIKWGGGRDSAPAVVDLGYGIRPFPEGYGLRKALWDAAYGYINGFPITAIAYYTLTRSLHWRIHRWAMKREGFGWDDELQMPIVYVRDEPTEAAGGER